MNVRPQEGLLAAIDRLEKTCGGRIVHRRLLPASPPERVPVQGRVPQSLRVRLAAMGIEDLYRHQAEAGAAAKAGRDLVLSAPTANGKSLAYMLPLAEALESDPQATAIYVSPAKALAQQQMARFRAFAPDSAVAMYDGDTPKEDRRAVRDTARMVYTNPDMLHLGILPYHRGWKRFLAGLRYVVLDESHQYTGAFGSHVAQILRRLIRVAGLYGARPTFLLLSATVGNPTEHGALLIGRPVTLIQGAGGGRGERHFLLWDPQSGEGANGPVRASVTAFASLVSSGLKTLLFGQTRQRVERMFQDARDALRPHGLQEAVAIYRSGYQAEERRRIEQGLFSGRYLGVVATNALELGIDVGDLDAVVMDGFPGTVASLWQQAGRAGRGESPSLAVLVLGEDVLDRYLVQHPDQVFERSVEQAVINPANAEILRGHLPAAAWESPLNRQELATLWAPAGAAVAKSIQRPGWGLLQDGTYGCLASSSPAAQVGIRGIGERFTIRAGGRILEETDAFHALIECYPGAVYLSQGQRYVIRSLDARERVIEATAVDHLAYYTEAITEMDVEVMGTPESRRAHAAFGRFRVRTAVTGFRKKDRYGNLIGNGDLEVPPYIMETEGFGLYLSRQQVASLRQERLDVHGSIHAVEHALVAVMPVAVSTDRRDIGGTSYESYRGKNPTVFLYDAVAGGVGYSRAAFANLDRLLAAAYDVIQGCDCPSGCPSCIQSPKCETGNEPLSKRGAIAILEMLKQGN